MRGYSFYYMRYIPRYMPKAMKYQAYGHVMLYMGEKADTIYSI